MRRIGITGTCVLIFTSGAILMAQDDKGGGMKMPSPEEMKAMMQRWEKAMTPAEPHKKLAEFVGEWDVTLKMWMMGPDGPPTETRGTATVTAELGGRFIREVLKAEMNMPDMATGEMKKINYEGQGLTGFDNFRNMYVGSWADNMNTHLLSMTGMADPAGKVIRMYGEMDEPPMNVIGRTVKYVTRIIDPDKHVLEIFDLHAGENFKVLEIMYTRKK